jgi:hypothetical protein
MNVYDTKVMSSFVQFLVSISNEQKRKMLMFVP